MANRLSKLEKAQRSNPGVPLFARLADEYLIRGRVWRALALCLEGCERFPSYPTGFLVLSRCYEAQGNHEDARGALDCALRLDPENPAGFSSLSVAYERLGEFTLALQCIQQASFLEPYSKALQVQVDRLHQLDQAGQKSADPEENTAELECKIANLRIEDDAGRGDESKTESDGVTEIPPLRDEVTGEVWAADSAGRPGESEPKKERLFDAYASTAYADWNGEANPTSVVGTPSGENLPAPISDGNQVEAGDGAITESAQIPIPAKMETGGDEVATLGAALLCSDKDQPEAKGVPEPGPASVKTGVPDSVSEQIAVAINVPVPEMVTGEDIDPKEPAALNAPSDTAGTNEQKAKSKVPVAKFSTRDDQELVDLLAQIEAAERFPTLGTGGNGNEEPVAPVPTLTLAELYSRQGIVNRAIDTYRAILRLHPEDDEIIARLASLEKRSEPFTSHATRGEDG